MAERKGLVSDFDEADYHADPALSQSAAKVLMACPARYRWQLDHPRADTAAFDVGHAAHAKVLGVGADIEVIEADSWRTKATTEAASNARAEGKVPLLRKDSDAVDLMAEAVMAHPMARLILEREGDAEQSAWWTDHADDGTPVECRARF
ncbi:MAG: PD-(D/E)XK nuclease-like domain-containing protein, partial [Actinomycetota bacterium]|nr:PD-(D/E)XK nuclease-like domain-containing protein [Actinomycetota bacterium]